MGISGTARRLAELAARRTRPRAVWARCLWPMGANQQKPFRSGGLGAWSSDLGDDLFIIIFQVESITTIVAMTSSKDLLSLGTKFCTSLRICALPERSVGDVAHQAISGGLPWYWGLPPHMHSSDSYLHSDSYPQAETFPQ